MRQKIFPIGELRQAIFFMIGAFFSLSLLADEGDYSSAPVVLSPLQEIEATVSKQQTRLEVGQSFWLSVDLILPEPLRSGWILPLSDWPATHLDLFLPKQLEIRQIQWPIPKVDLSVSPPQIYYQGRLTVLVEIFWKKGEERSKELEGMEAQLLIQGQARWSNQAHLYEISRLVILPTVLLPNEISMPKDPFTVGGYLQAKERLPQRVDPASVDWQIGKGGIEIRGKNLSSASKWVAVAYRAQARGTVDSATTPMMLSHEKIGDRDIFDVPAKTILEWKRAQVEEILLINHRSDQAWIISLVGDETINYSLMQQLSSWCQKVWINFSNHL